MLSLFLLKEYVSEHAGFVGINLRKLIENEEVSINENKRALILELGTLVDLEQMAPDLFETQLYCSCFNAVYSFTKKIAHSSLHETMANNLTSR